jgi:murein tripeptide amidase MpaA
MAYPSKVDEITARMDALDQTYAECEQTDLPHRTWEGGAGGAGRTVRYLRIGTGVGEGRARVLIAAGTHARELAPPDAVLTLLEKLLAAYKKQAPVKYAAFVDSRTQPRTTYKEFVIDFPTVKRIVERCELYVIPCVNPDGRDYVLTNKVVGWRKNRRPAPPNMTCPPFPPEVSAGDVKQLSREPAGVDLNRNYDVAWDINTYYDTLAVTNVGVSNDPCAPQQIYHGPSPASEPETRNVQELIVEKKVSFYVDVHSYARKFLFAWGMEANQTTKPEQTFRNPALDRKADGTGGRDGDFGTAYAEWMPAGREQEHRLLGDRMVNAILDSTGYTAADAAKPDGAIARQARESSRHATIQSPELSGLLTGVSRDFAFAQSIGATPGPAVTATALDPVYSYTFECGAADDGGFQPRPVTQYPKIEREVGAALFALLGFAATWHAPVPPPPPAPMPSPPPPPPAGKGDGVCSMDAVLAGTRLAGGLPYLRMLRDRVLGRSLPGRFAIVAYYWASPHCAPFLRRHRLVRGAVRIAVLAPLIAVLRAVAGHMHAET